MPSQNLNRANLDKDDILIVKGPVQLVNDAFGPFFIGFNISAALFGVICAQACLYFKRHAQDTIWLKSIVVVLVLLETLHIALITHALYVCGISNHGDFHCFRHAVWSAVMQAIPSALIVAIVQYVWIMRIRILSRSKRRSQFTAGMLFSVFIETGMSITLTAKAGKSPMWGVILGERWPVMACFVLKALNDMLLTGLLCYHLQRSKNGLRETDTMIQQMMGYGLRAGLFNCMGSIATLILLVVIPTKRIYIGVYLVFARLYTNSLIAMLNWRRSPQTSGPADFEASESQSVELSTLFWGQSMHLAIPELEHM